MSDAVARTDVSNLDFIGAKDDDGDGSGAVRRKSNRYHQ